MNMYSNHPQARAMQNFIHDSNRELSLLRQLTTKLREWIKENSEKAKESGIDIHGVRLAAEYFTSREIGMKKVIDTYYKEFEADFPDHTLTT